MAMEIRAARPEHDAAIAALHGACFADAWPEDMISRRRDCFLVAEDTGALAGYVMLTSVLDEGSIDSIAVQPELRCCGVGDALTAAAIRRGREMKLSFITLEVRAGNRAALALYEKRGFTEAGRRKNYYEKPREDAILMTLVL